MIGERSPGMRAEVVHLDAMPDVRQSGTTCCVDA